MATNSPICTQFLAKCYYRTNPIQPSHWFYATHQGKFTPNNKYPKNRTLNGALNVKVLPHSKFQTSSNHHFAILNPRLHHMTCSSHHHVTPHVTPHLAITISHAAQPLAIPGLVSSTAMLSKHPFIPWEIPWGFPHNPRSVILICPQYNLSHSIYISMDL